MSRWTVTLHADSLEGLHMIDVDAKNAANAREVARLQAHRIHHWRNIIAVDVEPHPDLALPTP